MKLLNNKYVIVDVYSTGKPMKIYHESKLDFIRRTGSFTLFGVFSHWTWKLRKYPNIIKCIKLIV